MQTESLGDKYSDPSNDYPDPSDDHTTENPISLYLASQLLSMAIGEQEHLKRRLSQLEHEIHSYHEVLTPKLPEDVLREIFGHCISITNQDAFLQPLRTRLSKPVPICLAQVCSSWRSIVMSMPALWSTLYVRFHPNRPVDHIRTTCAQAHQWLARSGMHPLTILIDAQSSSLIGDKERETQIAQFIESLIRYSHRCRVLRFSCPNTWLESWTSVNPTDVPILRTFEHQVPFLIDPTAVHNLWTSLQLLSATSLREVGLVIPHIHKGGFPRVLPLDHIVFDSLTQLYLRTGHASLVEIWHILSRCTRLETCLLVPGRASPTDGITIPTGSISTLPNLTMLRLHDSRGSLWETPQFFSHLDLPSLDSFQLVVSSWSLGNLWTRMEACLHVTNLCLECRHLDSKALRGLLRGNRSILRLRLTTEDLEAGDILPYLFADLDKPKRTLCPHLQTLEIDDLLPSWSTANLITLLTTRAQLEDRQGNVRFQHMFLGAVGVNQTLWKKLEELESVLLVRVSLTHGTLEGHHWHEKLVRPPEWPLSAWKITGGTLQK